MTERKKTLLLIAAIILVVVAVMAAVFGFGWQSGAAIGAAAGARLVAGNVKAANEVENALKETSDALKAIAATTTEADESIRLLHAEIDEMSPEEKIALASKVLNRVEQDAT